MFASLPLTSLLLFSYPRKNRDQSDGETFGVGEVDWAEFREVFPTI